MTTPAPDELRRFVSAIETHFGVRCGDRAGTLAATVASRAAARAEPLAAYLHRVETGEREELRALAPEVQVGETYFFRHVEMLHVFADLVSAPRPRRVLSAGCSSGEEPYTLAMLAQAHAPDPRAIAIHAIDVNPAALARGALARYSRWALRATPPDQQARWFRPDGRDFVLADEIRRAVAFTEANLLADGAWNAAPFDVIFCRNVTMYFSPETARRVIDRLVRALVPGGLLFLGHAESLRGADHALELCHTHGTFYYRRRGPALAGGSLVGAVAADVAHARLEDSAWFREITEATERVHALVDAALAHTASAAPAREALGPIRALIQTESFAEARRAFAALPSDAAATDEALLLDAIISTQSGELAPATTACEALLARDPRDARGHYLLALCRGSIGDTAGSERHARIARELDPSFAMASVQLGLLARRAGELAAAAEHLAQAIVRLASEDPERLALFSGGFDRAALVALCRAELAAAGVR